MAQINLTINADNATELMTELANLVLSNRLTVTVKEQGNAILTPASNHIDATTAVKLDKALDKAIDEAIRTEAAVEEAAAAEPGNPLVTAWEQQAAAQRERNEVTLPSTIGREKGANPFVRCDQPGVVATASQHAGRTLTEVVEVLAEIRLWKNNF